MEKALSQCYSMNAALAVFLACAAACSDKTPSPPVDGASTDGDVAVADDASVDASVLDASSSTDAAHGDFASASSDGAVPIVTFDFYIAPNGDDNNDGSLTHPWSITALNSKQSTYSGKNICVIGDVGGTQTPIQYGTIGGTKTTLYSIMQALTVGAAVVIDGGTASSPTYLASCTSAGAYKARWAIVDAADPTSSMTSSNPVAIVMGQPFYQIEKPVAHPGNLTIDGLVVRNFSYAGILIGDVQTTTLSNVVIKNCEVYNGTCTTSAENPGCIFLGTTSGAQIINDKIHDCRTTGGSFHPWGMGGITTYKALGLVVKSSTIYNAGYAIQNKDSNQWGTYSYNYLDSGSFGSANNMEEAGAIKGTVPGTGETLTLHHNIILGTVSGFGEDSKLVSGTITAYNNTFYDAGTQFCAIYFYPSSTTAGALNWYNNIVYAAGYATGADSPGALWANNGWGLTATSVDYNAYGAGMTFGTAYTAMGEDHPLSFWQGLGYDKNSTTLSTSPFTSTPTALDPSSFAISGAAKTAGKNGVASGALDGSGSVGCDF